MLETTARVGDDGSLDTVREEGASATLGVLRGVRRRLQVSEERVFHETR